ncbi:hypothetical protein M2H13_22525 [Vibrio vulnificus]|nr:hypothetical protein [Vibrio vulnificus]MCU8120419.1 hypothetical protein [Vibrio vulnificus]MCU8163910.1 hypothetical protein [Vibrio vulnificus]MCU8387259.1 hypothetical protein [Vibrio vulnificus]
MVKLSCGHFCIACLRPLTRRYVTIAKTALGIRAVMDVVRISVQEFLIIEQRYLQHC